MMFHINNDRVVRIWWPTVYRGCVSEVTVVNSATRVDVWPSGWFCCLQDYKTLVMFLLRWSASTSRWIKRTSAASTLQMIVIAQEPVSDRILERTTPRHIGSFIFVTVYRLNSWGAGCDAVVILGHWRHAWWVVVTADAWLAELGLGLLWVWRGHSDGHAREKGRVMYTSARLDCFHHTDRGVTLTIPGRSSSQVIFNDKRQTHMFKVIETVWK